MHSTSKFRKKGRSVQSLGELSIKQQGLLPARSQKPFFIHLYANAFQ